MWATIRGDRIERVQLLEGTPALEVHAAHSFRLTVRQRLRLREKMVPGSALATTLDGAIEPPGRIDLLIEVRAEDQTIRLHRMDAMGVHRTACLITIQDRRGALVGHRLLEGVTALQQLEVLAEAAPQFPGPTGQPPETRTRHLVLAQVSIIAAAAKQIIDAIDDPTFDIRSLQPLAEDYAKVFEEPLRGQAQRHYERLWRTETPGGSRPTGRTQLRVAACPASALGAIPELTAGFPEGYLALASALSSGFTWVAWQHRVPGTHTGTARDGLVWIEDHWAWFPSLADLFQHGVST